MGWFDSLLDAGRNAWGSISNLGSSPGGSNFSSWMEPEMTGGAGAFQAPGPSVWDTVGTAAKTVGKAAFPGLLSMGAGALVDKMTGPGSPQIKGLPRSPEQITGDRNKAALSTASVGEANKYAADPNYKLDLNDYEMQQLMRRVAANRALTGDLKGSAATKQLNDAIAGYMAQRRTTREDEFTKKVGAANAASSGFSQPPYSHLIPGQPSAFGTIFGKYGVPTLWGILDSVTGQDTLSKVTKRRGE